MKIETESKRLKATKRYADFHNGRENDLQQIVMLASAICQSPIALITLMEQDWQMIKSRTGVDLEMMPRSTSFCTHAIEQEEVMVVQDATADERFADAPVVANDPHIRFYASANLKSYDGHNVGTLCVYDTKPKSLNEEQIACLAALANQVSHIMELDHSLKQLTEQNKALREIAWIQSHEIRQPVSSILGILSLMKEDDDVASSEYINLLDQSVKQLDERIRTIVDHTQF